MRLKSTVLTLIFGIITAAPALAAPEPWRIGVLVCVSGACAESGKNSLDGIQLAVDEINQAGGVLGRPIEIKLEDTVEGTSSGAGAVTAFKKLLEDPAIKYLIGPSWTPGGLSVAPLAAKRPDIIITSPSLGVADFDRAGDNIFNLWPHDENASKNLAKVALDKGWKRVAVFSSQQPWEILQGATFADEFQRLGGTIVAKEEPLPTSTDLRPEALKIRKENPDAVFFSGYTQIAVTTKLLRSMGYTGPFFTILMEDSRIEAAQGALDQTIYSGYAAPDEDFVKRYRARYGKEPGIGADTSYDVVKLYAWAVSKTGDFDTAKVQKTLLTAEFPGASGLIKFDEFGGVKKDPVLYRVAGKEKIRLNG